MTETRSPFHYGGPLGLGALVAAAGAAGVFLYTNSGADLAEKADHPMPVVVTSASTDTQAVEAQEKPDAETTIDVKNIEKAASTDQKSVETSRPSVKPLGLPAADVSPVKKVETMPAQAKGTEVTFIVRIKGSEDIDQAARLFRKDRAEAMRAFAHYVETAPALKDFSLVGGSYSGEIRLAYILPPGKDADRATINEIKKTIMSVDGVSYADPDFVAHPGKE